MSSVLYIGGAGPSASIIKHNGINSGSINPGQASLNLNLASLGGNVGSSRRRLWFLILGISYCTGMTWNGTPVDFFDNAHGDVLAGNGGIVLGSIGEPSGTSGTLNLACSPLSAQNFRTVIFVTDGLGKPTTPTDDDFNSTVGVAPTVGVTVKTRKGGLIIGGSVANGAVSLSAAGSIANWTYTADGSSDWVEMWEAPVTTTGNKLINVTATGAASIDMGVKAWAFR